MLKSDRGPVAPQNRWRRRAAPALRRGGPAHKRRHRLPSPTASMSSKVTMSPLLSPNFWWMRRACDARSAAPLRPGQARLGARARGGRRVDLPHDHVYAPRDAARRLQAREAAGIWAERDGQHGVREQRARARGGGGGVRGERQRTTKATSRVINIHAADMSASSVVISPTPETGPRASRLRLLSLWVRPMRAGMRVRA